MIIRKLQISTAFCSFAVGLMYGQNTGVGWWRFDEGSGQMISDSSGLGNNGFLGSTPVADPNDPSWITPGRLGPSALNFLFQDFVQVPTSATLQPNAVSVQAWVKAPGSPGAFEYIVGKGASGCMAASYALYTGQDGGAVFYIFDGTNFHLSPEVPSSSVWNGSWHNLMGTYDGSTVRLYLDGVQMGTGTATGGANIAYNLPTSNDVFIGSYSPAGCLLPFTGSIDEVRIWNQVLSPSVISTLATKSCNYVSIGATPTTVEVGGTLNVTARLQNCQAAFQQVVIEFETTTPCTKSVNLSIPVLLPPNFNQGISFSLPILKGSCTGNYSVSATTSINKFPVTMSSVTVDVAP